MITVSQRIRQFLVNAITGKLWPIMPRRLKLWAFMNDDDPPGIDDYNDENTIIFPESLK